MAASCVPYAIIGMAFVAGVIWFIFGALPKMIDRQHQQEQDKRRAVPDESARLSRAAEATAEAHRLRQQQARSVSLNDLSLTDEDRQDLGRLYDSPSAAEPPPRREWA
jgi:hypothetical protein